MATDYTSAKPRDAIPLLLAAAVVGLTGIGASIQVQATGHLAVESFFQGLTVNLNVRGLLLGLWVVTAVLLTGSLAFGGRRTVVWVAAWCTAAVIAQLAGDARGALPWLATFAVGILAWAIVIADRGNRSPMP